MEPSIGSIVHYKGYITTIIGFQQVNLKLHYALKTKSGKKTMHVPMHSLIWNGEHYIVQLND